AWVARGLAAEAITRGPAVVAGGAATVEAVVEGEEGEAQLASKPAPSARASVNDARRDAGSSMERSDHRPWRAGFTVNIVRHDRRAIVRAGCRPKLVRMPQNSAQKEGCLPRTRKLGSAP